MYYYGARYYDPRVSIWLSVDPLAQKAPNENSYIYCSDNPIKFIDPDGKFKTKFGAWLHKTFNGGGSDTRQNSKTKEFYYIKVSEVAKEDGGGIAITPVYGKKETSIFKITNGISFWGDKKDGDSTGNKGVTTDSAESSDIPHIGGSAGKIGELSGLGKVIDIVKNFLEGLSAADGVQDRVETIVNTANQSSVESLTSLQFLKTTGEGSRIGNVILPDFKVHDTVVPESQASEIYKQLNKKYQDDWQKQFKKDN